MPTMTKIQTKTKTAVAIALAVALVGVAGFSVAGLYYYGQRINYISSKNNCDCPVCPVCPKCDTADTSGDDSDDNSNDDSGNNGDTSGGDVDLGFKMDYGTVTGVSGSSTTNGQGTTYSVSVTNTGTSSAGSFKVKTYIAGWNTTDSNSTLINTWDVSGLAAGQTLTKTFSYAYKNLSAHIDYYVINKIDADNQIKEKNEASCAYPPGPTVGCNEYFYSFYVYR